LEPGTRNPKPKNDIKDVVFLHGWGLDASIWRELAGQLEPRFRIHALDLPGYGAAPACTPYALTGLADAVANAAPKRCFAVGWSLGGQVALAWARRAPQQVERLALIATTPSFTRRARWTCAVAPRVFGEFARELAADGAGTLTRFAALQARGDGRARQVISALRRSLALCGEGMRPALEGGLGILHGSDLRAELPAVGQPALVLQGARDALVPPAAARRLAAALPDARLEIMRGCGHAPFLSQPERVAQTLSEFFDG